MNLVKKIQYNFIYFLFLISLTGYAQTVSVSGVAKVGQTVVFNATVDGTTPFTYQWKKDGVNINYTSPLTAPNSYAITNVTTAAAGNYTVYITNQFGNTTSNIAQLKVLPAPVFTTQPAGINIIIGTALSLTAIATGTPTPTYQWFKDGVSIPGATSSTYSVQDATSSNSGTYYAVATSTLDGVTNSTNSNNAIVAVTGKAPSVINISIQIN